MGNAWLTVRIPLITKIKGANKLVNPNGTHSVIHHMTIQTIVPNAIFGEFEEENIFSEFEFVVVLFVIEPWEKGNNNTIIKSKGPKIKPIFSLLFLF